MTKCPGPRRDFTTRDLSIYKATDDLEMWEAAPGARRGVGPKRFPVLS